MAIVQGGKTEKRGVRKGDLGKFQSGEKKVLLHVCVLLCIADFHGCVEVCAARSARRSQWLPCVIWMTLSPSSRGHQWHSLRSRSKGFRRRFRSGVVKIISE